MFTFAEIEEQQDVRVLFNFQASEQSHWKIVRLSWSSLSCRNKNKYQIRDEGTFGSSLQGTGEPTQRW